MNEPDAYALEEALRLREKHGGEVVVCSAGPARVQQVIPRGAGRGADRAIHVEDDALGAPTRSAAAGAGAGHGGGAFDLDPDRPAVRRPGSRAVRPVLAERLGMPHSTIIMEVQVVRRPAALRVKRELEGGWFQW